MMRDKKGIHNSYNSPDSINTIDWRNKTIHHDVFDYVRELITLRKNHPAFRMGDADKVRQYMEFLPVEGSNLVAFILKDNANGDSWKILSWRSTAVKSLPNYLFRPVAIQSFAKMENQAVGNGASIR